MSHEADSSGTVGQPAPDLALPDSSGGVFHLREHLTRGPVALFFFIHNGTPG
ncbi:MAG: hypothetical protein HYR73_08350 [Candidatus Eisenbacteria bacterium]|nr:hypothetical protein [Candidatus Eisenbacteria bacterium]